MKSILSNFLIFATGAAVGSVVAWKLIDEKYNRIMREEIDSVKAEFSRLFTDDLDEEEPTEYEQLTIEETAEPDATVDIRELAAKAQELGYTNYSDATNTKDKEVKKVDDPYVIAPDEFGELDYEMQSLTYYADGVLADDLDYVIENVDDVVGLESLDHFGEYEDDSVFVRNDLLKIDYEILLDTRRFSDVVNPGPHYAEDE